MGRDYQNRSNPLTTTGKKSPVVPVMLRDRLLMRLPYPMMKFRSLFHHSNIKTREEKRREGRKKKEKISYEVVAVVVVVVVGEVELDSESSNNNIVVVNNNNQKESRRRAHSEPTEGGKNTLEESQCGSKPPLHSAESGERQLYPIVSGERRHEDDDHQKQRPQIPHRKRRKR